MVPDKDRRAIERKVFPAEVGMLLRVILNFRFVQRLSTSPPRPEKD